MSKRPAWLDRELAAWTAEGLLDAEQAGRIRARYQDPGTGINWTRLVFTSLGAVILGLGVILFFAANWQAIPKAGKLGLVFAALAAAHGGGWWCTRQGGRAAAAGEGLHLLGTMLFGAGIWLVAQVYHIEEHYPNAFLVWGLGTLALAWALPSVGQALLATALLLTWHGCESLDFSAVHHAGVLLLTAGLVPLALRLRSGLLAWATLVAVPAAACMSAGHLHESLVLVLLLLLASAWIGAGRLADDSERLGFAAAPLLVLGWGCYLVLLYICCYDGVVTHAIRRLTFSLALLPYLAVPLALAVLAWALAFMRSRAGLQAEGGLPRQELAVPVVTVALLLCATVLPDSGSRHDLGLALSWAFTLIFLFHGLTFMARGCQRTEARFAVLGSLMVIAIAIPKFLTLFDSLLARSAVFILTGAFIAGAGFWYSRAKRERQEAA